MQQGNDLRILNANVYIAYIRILHFSKDNHWSLLLLIHAAICFNLKFSIFKLIQYFPSFN